MHEWVDGWMTDAQMDAWMDKTYNCTIILKCKLLREKIRKETGMLGD